VGSAVRIVVVTDASVRADDDHHPGLDAPDAGDTRDTRDARGPRPAGGSGTAAVVALHPAGAAPVGDAADDVDLHDIDLDDLVDAPPESVVSPIDRLAQAFPGSELLDERS
jgi:hypothetical protein